MRQFKSFSHTNRVSSRVIKLFFVFFLFVILTLVWPPKQPPHCNLPCCRLLANQCENSRLGRKWSVLLLNSHKYRPVKSVRLTRDWFHVHLLLWGNVIYGQFFKETFSPHDDDQWSPLIFKWHVALTSTTAFLLILNLIIKSPTIN